MAGIKSCRSDDKDRLLSREYFVDKVQYGRLPVGIWCLERAGILSRLSLAQKKKLYQMSILVLTFLLYASLHMARVTSSVVKSTLHPKCDSLNSTEECAKPSNHCDGWRPFDGAHGKSLLGVVDYVWLFSYAIFMFFSGQVADHSNLRYFLTFGMLGSSLSIGLFGTGYFLDIHHLAYFLTVQVLGGAMQSCGWPGVVAVMANWFGKHRRGLIMGIWNCHVSVGNLLGYIIPGIWAHHHWGISYLVSCSIMLCVTALIFLFLVTDPAHVGLPPPKHQLESEEISSTNTVVTKTDLLRKQHQQEAPSSSQTLNTAYGSTDVTAAVPRDNANVNPDKEKAIKIWRALLIPGVVEFSLALFFSKLVIYSFLFWLPFYVKNTQIGHRCLSTFQSGALSSMFDVGAMIGSILAGSISDLLQARAFTSVASLVFAIPSLFLFREFGSQHLGLTIAMMIVTGIFINGPYAMITTAVSADLGTHKSLRNNQRAKATVTAIIDGTGSIGGAVGPLLTGVLVDYGSWDDVFYLFMGSSLVSALLMSRLVYKEVKSWRISCLATQHSPISEKSNVVESSDFISDLHNEEANLIH